MTLAEVKGTGMNRSLGQAFTVKAEKAPSSQLGFNATGSLELLTTYRAFPNATCFLFAFVYSPSGDPREKWDVIKLRRLQTGRLRSSQKAKRFIVSNTGGSLYSVEEMCAQVVETSGEYRPSQAKNSLGEEV